MTALPIRNSRKRPFLAERPFFMLSLLSFAKTLCILDGRFRALWFLCCLHTLSAMKKMPYWCGQRHEYNIFRFSLRRAWSHRQTARWRREAFPFERITRFPSVLPHTWKTAHCGRRQCQSCGTAPIPWFFPFLSARRPLCRCDSGRHPYIYHGSRSDRSYLRNRSTPADWQHKARRSFCNSFCQDSINWSSAW